MDNYESCFWCGYGLDNNRMICNQCFFEMPPWDSAITWATVRMLDRQILKKEQEDEENEMTNKGTVTLEYQVSQSRKVKKLEAENSRLRAKIRILQERIESACLDDIF